jgi:hypothetical protein
VDYRSCPLKLENNPVRHSTCRNRRHFLLNKILFALFEEIESSVWLPRSLQQGVSWPRLTHFRRKKNPSNWHSEAFKSQTNTSTIFSDASRSVYCGRTCCDSSSNVGSASCATLAWCIEQSGRIVRCPRTCEITPRNVTAHIVHKERAETKTNQHA